MCKNAIVLMITMLGCSEVNIKILNANMKTVEFDNCREISENNRNTNNILVIIQEKAKFFL